MSISPTARAARRGPPSRRPAAVPRLDRLVFGAAAAALLACFGPLPVAAAAQKPPSPQLEAAAQSLNTAVCPGTPPQGAAQLLHAAPYTVAQLPALLSHISAAALANEKPATRARLQQSVAAAKANELGAFAVVLHLMNRDNAAVYVLAEQARRAPSATSRSNLGAALLSLGDYGDAYRVLSAVLRDQPGWMPAVNNMAVVQANLGDLKGAEQSLRRVVAAEPRLTIAQFGLGRVIECEDHDLRRALPILQAAVADDPTSAEADFVAALAGRPAHNSDDDGDASGDADANSNATSESADASPGAAFGGVYRTVHIEGALERPQLPGSPEGWVAEYVPSGGSAMKAVRRFAVWSVIHAGAANAYQDSSEEREKLPSTAGPGLRVIRFSDRATLKALERVTSRFRQRTNTASNQLDDGIERQVAPVIERAGQHIHDLAMAGRVTQAQACSILRSAATAAYQTFRGLYNTEFTELNAASQDFARDASRLIARLHDPWLAASQTASALGEIEEANSSAYSDVITFAPPAAGALPCLGGQEASAGDANKKAPQETKREPCETFVDNQKLMIVTLKITCEQIEISGGEGFLGNLVFNARTHSATIFVGAGLSVGGDGLPQVGGEIGIVVGITGSGEVTDAGFKWGARGSIANHSIDLTTTMTWNQGIDFSPDYGLLDGPIGTPTRPHSSGKLP